MKVHRLAIVLVVLLTTSSAVAVPAAASTNDGGGAGGAQSMVTLTVTVTDKFDEGIGGTELTAEWDGGSNTARTASNGKAFVDVREGADVELSVEHDRYTRNNPVVVRNAEERDVSVIVSRKGEATVTVVDDGSPLADARVVMTKAGQDRPAAEGRTDGDGVFQSGTIERGTYEVEAVKPGYYRNTTSIGVDTATETTVELTEGAITVDVSVRDDHFEEPKAVDGAKVEIEGPTTASLTTSGSGKGTLGLSVNARYTVTVTKDGYETASRSVRIGEESKSLAFTLNREDALTVEAVNERVVVGENVQLEVTDEYGDRVEGATVSVDGEAVGETDADGVYRAAIDSEGDHAITAEKDGVTSAEVTVEGVTTGGDGTPADTPTDDSPGAEEPPELPDFSQPTMTMKIGAAAVGVLFAFVLVRRLL